MLVAVGLIVLVVASLAALVGVLANAGPTHPVDGFALFGYHHTGSTGSLFLVGIVVGALALFGLLAVLVGAQRAVLRATEARRADARFRREMAFINRDRDRRVEKRDRA